MMMHMKYSGVQGHGKTRPDVCACACIPVWVGIRVWWGVGKTFSGLTAAVAQALLPLFKLSLLWSQCVNHLLCMYVCIAHVCAVAVYGDSASKSYRKNVSSQHMCTWRSSNSQNKLSCNSMW